MKLTQKELEIIRIERKKAYKNRVEAHLKAFDGHTSVKIFTNDLITLVNLINEIEKELYEKYPKWDECPF